MEGKEYDINRKIIGEDEYLDDQLFNGKLKGYNYDGIINYEFEYLKVEKNRKEKIYDYNEKKISKFIFKWEKIGCQTI